ncbi:MAG TPA: hypothetical protein VL522_04975 [Bordetella sp.]|jgi:hypothetical protein|nr:hypothetical protein [Bordetella sp.]
MKTEPYDVSRLAALVIDFILSSGVDVEDAMRVLTTAERMLRDTYEDERRRSSKADPGQPMLH